MSGSFIQALQRKPWEKHVQTNAKSTFLVQNALPSPTLVPGSLHDDGSGLPTAASGGSISPERPVIRRMSVKMADRDGYEASGAELIMGSGQFVAPKTVEVRLNDGGRRVLAGDRVFLDLETHAAIPKVARLEEAKPLTHIEALELDYVPPHLIVLGAATSVSN